MTRLALMAFVLLGAGGCTLIYGPQKQGADLGDAPDDLAGSDAMPGDGNAPPAWTIESAGTLQDLHAVGGCTATNLFAPGTGGTLDRSTTMAAATWTPMLVGANALFGVTTSTCADIYVVGKAGVAAYSSDGTTFKVKMPVATDLFGVWSNGNAAAAVGAGGVTLSVMLGNSNWMTKPSGTTQDLNAVWGSGTTFYAAGGAGTILRSTNSGLAWTAKTFGTATLRGGWASASGDDVYAVGDGGVILHSSDGGSTWPAATSGVTTPLRAVWGSAADDVYVVGAGGVILHSSDGGATFTADASNTTADLNGVWGSSAGDVYTVGDSGTILHR